MNATTQKASCIFYNYTVKDGLCKNIITSLYVYGDNSTLERGEVQTKRLQNFLNNVDVVKISAKCQPIMIDLFCRYQFPPCDTSLDKPRARGICRRSCVYLDQDLCKEEMIVVRQTAGAAPVLEKNMIDCTLYDVANGGDSPECYQYHTVPGVFDSTQ